MCRILYIIIIIFQAFYTQCLYSQNSFYNVDSIKEIRIYFYDANWDDLLDSLYVLGDKQRIFADLLIDGVQYDSVGVRYKGFSSVSVNRVKNPFNIKLDYSIKNQDHNGIDKIKLSNIYHDPSFIREVLSYEIARKYMPAPESNFANLYINDTLWGLYTNVEAINKDFINKHFSSRYNSFFKCNPENLQIFPGGLNSDLSFAHGNDSTNYYPYYDIESDYGWSDLFHLIDTLNNFTDSLENILDINRTLWMHAFNYCLINFDSYVGYSQNYYLYQNNSNQFSPILWDLNMSFGSFNLTDASQLFFSGFSIQQSQEMDPLNHYNYISVSPRPLMRKLFEVERYRKMYLAHIRTIMEENFINQDYYYRSQYLQNIIDSYVQNDTNKFYSYSDFLVNLNSQLSLPSTIVPGIAQLMDSRSIYLSNYKGFTGEPSISNISYSPNSLNLGSDLFFTVDVDNAQYVQMSYRYGDNMRFRHIQMYDDGNHYDSLPGDGIFGVKISNCSNNIDYFFYAENDSSGIFSPVRSSYEYYNLNLILDSSSLVINEIMSNNKNVVSDNSGNFEDWIELYNMTDYVISTKGLFLTDTLSNIYKWELPNAAINPKSYYIVWADEDGKQGGNHANFKLSNLGETIMLSNSDGTLIDSITFYGQPEDLSFGRTPNGYGNFSILTPTFDGNNNITDIIKIEDKLLNCYPNPFNEQLVIDSEFDFYITDLYGRNIFKSTSKNSNIINTSSWNQGLYFVFLNNSSESTIKLIKIK